MRSQLFGRVVNWVKEAWKILRPDHPREVGELIDKAERVQEKLRRSAQNDDKSTPDPSEDPFLGL